MKESAKTSKLSLQKFQISKINNAITILGGNGGGEDDWPTITDTQGGGQGGQGGGHGAAAGELPEAQNP